jgi:hypothetical protein
MKKSYQLLVILVVAISSLAIAQIPNTRFKDGIKLYLSKDSVSWLKTTVGLQTWVRFTENNPGSTINNYEQKETFDIGIRRMRMQLFGNISKRVFFYSQFGLNNFNSNSTRKQGAFFHDLTTEYELVPKHLSIGSGLSGWSGLSRFASPAIASTMMYDAPLFEQTTNDVTDQFLRKLSIYAKGKLSKLDYRVAVSKPMNIQNAQAGLDTSLTTTGAFSPEPPKLQSQAYINWQFLDQEANQTPYTTGTYLGKKRVFNIGAGFIYQPDAIRYLDANGTKRYTAMNLWSVDVFLDYALNKEKQNAITVYGGYFNFDFGPNYIRNLGVMNDATGSNNSAVKKFSGFGNAFPMFGTGNVIYLQTGYLFKHDLFKDKGTIMPNADVMIANYNALKTPMVVFNAGLNYYITGHNSKLSFNYQYRPIFTQLSPTGAGEQVDNQSKGMYVLQYQIFF